MDGVFFVDRSAPGGPRFVPSSSNVVPLLPVRDTHVAIAAACAAAGFKAGGSSGSSKGGSSGSSRADSEAAGVKIDAHDLPWMLYQV